MRAIFPVLLALWMGWGVGSGVSAAQTNSLPEKERSQLEAQGLDHFYNLEYDPAIAIFERLRAAEPENPAWYNHLAMTYFYQGLHAGGGLEGDLFDASNKFFRKKVEFAPATKQRFWQANEAAVRLCEGRLKQNAKDPEALYACGVAYAMRSTFQGLVERAKLAFIRSGNRANDYHSRLVALNPRYYDAYLVPGVYDFALGSLPAPLKFLLYFAGLSGNKERGLEAVKSAALWGEHAREDAKIVLTVMYRREKRFDDARRTLRDLARQFPRNYLLPLEIASLYRASGDLQEAIRDYEKALEETRRDKPGYQDVPLARLHYELGELYRKTGELELARTHLAQVAGARGSTPDLEQESKLLLQQVNEALQSAKPPQPPVPPNSAGRSPAPPSARLAATD